MDNESSPQAHSSPELFHVEFQFIQVILKFMFERWLKTTLKNTLLIGPRRSGKTRYLRSAFPELRYVTLDDFDIEIKATEKSAQRDIRHLRSFLHSVKDKEVKAYVVYLGTEYDEIEGVRFIPIAALYRALNDPSRLLRLIRDGRLDGCQTEDLLEPRLAKGGS